MADNDEVTVLEIGVEGRPGRLESEDRQRVDRAIAYGEAASGAVSQAAEAARLAAADVAAVAGLTARSVVRADRSEIAQIDGKLEFFVTKPTRAVSYGAAGHVVMIGARYTADFLALRQLEIVGVPSNYAGVRINAGGTLYAPEKISKAARGYPDHGHVPQRHRRGSPLPAAGHRLCDRPATMGLMETDPATAALLAQMPTRGITMFDNNAIASLSWGTHGPAVLDTTVLTSNRIRNLMTNSTQRLGDIFEITRSGGDTGGPWNLTIRSAPSTILADLKVNQWGRFVFTGTAWALLARGSLA